jgi:hypothetical protein
MDFLTDFFIFICLDVIYFLISPLGIYLLVTFITLFIVFCFCLLVRKLGSVYTNGNVGFDTDHFKSTHCVDSFSGHNNSVIPSPAFNVDGTMMMGSYDLKGNVYGVTDTSIDTSLDISISDPYDHPTDHSISHSV